MNKTETQVIEDLLRQAGKMGLLDEALTDQDFEFFIRKASPDIVSLNFKQRAVKAMRAAQAKRKKASGNE